MTDLSLSLEARCDAVEDCYEFMLAYAAQGLGTEGGEIRGYLGRAAAALSGIGDECAADGVTRAFTSVVERDAESSLAAIEMVLGQPTISSQLIDNLNASIHLRALLTDLFLIDEILKLRRLAGGG